MVETLIETIEIEAITILAARAVIGKTMMMVELHQRIAIIEISMDQKIEIGKLKHFKPIFSIEYIILFRQINDKFI